MRYEFLSNFELFSLKILSIGFSSDTKITWAKCARKEFIIHYVTDGYGYYNGVKIGKGEGFIIPPDHYADYHPDSQKPWSFFWIILTKEAYQSIKKIYRVDDNFIFNYKFIDVINEFGNRIVKETPIGYLISDIWEIFYGIIIEHIKEIQNENDDSKKSYARYAKEYFDINYHKPVRINDLCKLLNISQPFLYKEFKKKYGISMKQYLVNRKISHACDLLISSSLNVTQIAESVGFDDVLAFSSFFKKNVGLSPSDYKKRQKL